MKHVAIIGRLNESKLVFDGQCIKTRIFADEIERGFGQSQTKCIDTVTWHRHPLRLLIKTARAVYECKSIVLMVSQKGVQFFSPLLALLKGIWNRPLHYVVIGGWLDSLLARRKWMVGCLKRFDVIYVETDSMKKALEKRGLSNVVVLPNCKALSPLAEDELVYNTSEPYRLCTFSRVMREKGIDIAVEAVKEINTAAQKTVCTLDIYGAVPPNQTEWFAKLQEDFPENIQYCGTVAYERSVDVIKDYFALLFPTRYYTEGIPGTILDAFAAGVPVIAAAWENHADVLGAESVVYPFEDEHGLLRALKEAVSNPDAFNARKTASLSRFEEFSPDRIRNTLLPRLKGTMN